MAFVLAFFPDPTRAANLSSSPLPLTAVADVGLPGRPTRLDYQSLDPAMHRLFISHMGDDNVIVFDTLTREVVGTVNDIGTPTGVLAVPREQTVFASATRTDSIVDRYPLAGAQGDHGFYLDSPRRRAYVSCEDNNLLLVVDMTSLHVIQSFKVGDGPDVLAFDPGLGRLYVATESGVVSAFKVVPKGLAELGAGFVGDNAHTVAVDPGTHLVYFPLKDVDGRPVLRIMEPAGSRSR